MVYPTESIDLTKIIDSETWMRVADILTAPALLNDVPFLSPREQTYGLEAFHSVLLHFLPKTYCYSDEGMLARWWNRRSGIHFSINHKPICFSCRTQLAILHYNENADRSQVTKDGTQQYRLKASKLKKAWVVVPLKEDATYSKYLKIGAFPNLAACEPMISYKHTSVSSM